MIKRKKNQDEEEVKTVSPGDVTSDSLDESDANQPSPLDQYDGLRVGKSFDQKLEEFKNKNKAPEKDYTSDERARLASLLEQYKSAAATRANNQNRAGAWGIVAGNALGSDVGRATRENFLSGSNSEIEGLNDAQNAQEQAMKNEDSLVSLARRKSLMDPNSPLSKAYVDYERKTKGFGVNVPGLSAQDTIDASKSTNKVYGEDQNTNRTNIKESGQNARQEDKQAFDATQKSLDRGAAQQRVETAGKYGLGRTILGGDIKTSAGATKAGNEAVEGSIGITPELDHITPGDKKSNMLVPNPKAPPTPQQKTRMRTVTEFAGQNLFAIQNLQKALNDPDSSRAGRFFDLAKRTADATRAQYEAFSRQGDVKLNDNGVLNPADLTIAGQSLFGMDINSLKTIFISNPELANILNTRIKAIQKQYLDNISVNSYVRMNPEEARNMGASNYRSSSQPAFTAPGLMNELGIQSNQQEQPRVTTTALPSTEDPKAAIRARFEQLRKERAGK